MPSFHSYHILQYLTIFPTKSTNISKTDSKTSYKHYIFWPNLSPFETSWDNQTPLPTTEFPWISGSGGNTSGSGAGASSSEGAKGGASGSSWRMNGSMTSCLPWDSFPTIKTMGVFYITTEMLNPKGFFHHRNWGKTIIFNGGGNPGFVFCQKTNLFLVGG